MAQLAPSPKFRAVGADGLALVGGKLWTYVEGTSTPKASYTSFTLGASNTNPVILNARGEADVWLDGAYKLVLTDAADVVIWTVDSIRDLTQSQTFTGATLAGTLTVSSTAVTWSGNPTHSGNHTFSGNVTVNGNTQLGNASTDTLRIDPNAVTWTNNPTHSGNHTWSGTQTFSAAMAAAAATFSSTVAFNGVPTFSAAPAGQVVGTTYAPTITLVSNLTSASANSTFKYIRVGSIVIVFGNMAVDEAVAATLTVAGASLPVASNFSVANDLIGGGIGVGADNIIISADTTNDRAAIGWTSPTPLTPSHSVPIWFAYVII
jgi:hypothetical protein